jgi:hypothetical protein
MSFGITNTSQYDIRTLNVVTKYGVFDIRAVYSELNIFDSILQPCISGNILVIDSLGLNHTFQFDGTEFLKIEASKDAENLLIKKTFRIYKESDRRRNTMNSESYVLHFVSNEFIFSEQQTLNNFYSGTYAETVQKILETKLYVGEERYSIESSVGVRDIVIPNLKPIEALIWSSKRALNEFNLPNFMFFENLNGYNFLSLSLMKKQEPVMSVLFEPKNINDNVVREFFGARDLEIISQFDYLDNLMSGVYSGTFIGFDPLTRIIIEQPISFENIFVDDKMNRTSNFAKDVNLDGSQNNQMFGSRRIAYVTEIGRSNTSYVLANDKKSLNLKETPEYFALQRKAILKQLFSQRIKINLPGNFSLTAGTTLNIVKQKSSFYDDENENVDTSIFGKYLVVASRHIMRDNKHETILELVTDSRDIDENLPAMSVKEAIK